MLLANTSNNYGFERWISRFASTLPDDGLTVNSLTVMSVTCCIPDVYILFLTDGAFFEKHEY